jgi:hypothetical protein
MTKPTLREMVDAARAYLRAHPATGFERQAGQFAYTECANCGAFHSVSGTDFPTRRMRRRRCERFIPKFAGPLGLWPKEIPRDRARIKA